MFRTGIFSLAGNLRAIFSPFGSDIASPTRKNVDLSVIPQKSYVLYPAALNAINHDGTLHFRDPSRDVLFIDNVLSDTSASYKPAVKRGRSRK
jgi:hypothetical protein